MRLLSQVRNAAGQYIRQHVLWDGTHWDDGFTDNKGRFRVYRPDCPRAFASGYALRAHVVWWLAKGRCHRHGYVLHHRNEIKTDDQLDNLIEKSHAAHTRDYSVGPRVEHVAFTCESCQRVFHLTPGRVADRARSGYPIRFCTLRCRDVSPHNSQHRANISAGLRRAWAAGKMRRG